MRNNVYGKLLKLKLLRTARIYICIKGLRKSFEDLNKGKKLKFERNWGESSTDIPEQNI